MTAVTLTVPDPPGLDPYPALYGPWVDCSALGQSPLAELAEAAAAGDLVRLETAATQALTGAAARVNIAGSVAGSDTAPLTITTPISQVRAVRLKGQTTGLTVAVASTNAGGPQGQTGPAGPAGPAGQVPRVFLANVAHARAFEAILFQNATDADPYVITNPNAFQAAGQGNIAYPGGTTWDLTLALYDNTGTFVENVPLASGAFAITTGFSPAFTELGGVIATPFTVPPGYSIFVLMTPTGTFDLTGVTFVLLNP
jgi:hypothetical protein